MAEIAIIGSDIQEVIGSAIAISLLSSHKIPLWAGVLITGVDTFTFLFLESAGLRKLEAFFGALITTMAACFLYMYITVAPDQLQILQGLWFPWCQDCDRAAIKQLVGIIGAVIMPHNIYLHSALVLSRDVDRKDKGAVREANMYYSIESGTSTYDVDRKDKGAVREANMYYSIESGTSTYDVDRKDKGAVREANMYYSIESGTSTYDVDRKDKGAVREANMYYSIESAIALFVSFMVNLFVVTVFAAAFSDPKYADNASLRVAGFLHLRWAKWKRVLLTRAISIVPTVIVALVTASKLDDMTQWLNVLQSVQLPFALIPIMHFTNSERVMGEFKNTAVARVVVGFIVFLVIGVNMYLVSLYVTPGLMWYVYLVIGVVLAAYFSFLVFLVIGIKRYLKFKDPALRRLASTLELPAETVVDQVDLPVPSAPALVMVTILAVRQER
nr:hypothetical protein BaRGS_022341 [Batillaria attramentaria]